MVFVNFFVNFISMKLSFSCLIGCCYAKPPDWQLTDLPPSWKQGWVGRPAHRWAQSTSSPEQLDFHAPMDGRAVSQTERAQTYQLRRHHKHSLSLRHTYTHNIASENSRECYYLSCNCFDIFGAGITSFDLQQLKDSRLLAIWQWQPSWPNVL